MKSKLLRLAGVIFCVIVIGLSSGCLSARSRFTRSCCDEKHSNAVLIIYHVKPGAEDELEGLLAEAWNIYRREHLVCEGPHVCVRVKEDLRTLRFVEVFCWVGPFATEYPSDSVKSILSRIGALCEARDGNFGIEVCSAKITTTNGLAKFQ